MYWWSRLLRVDAEREVTAAKEQGTNHANVLFDGVVAQRGKPASLYSVLVLGLVPEQRQTNVGNDGVCPTSRAL